MTYGFGLGAGLKALTAARLGMQTAGNNISNANTPGYSRQRVLSASDVPFFAANGQQIGSGVRISSISRLVDAGVDQRIRAQLALFGEAEIAQTRLQEIEGIFNEPGGGISAVLGDLFGSISALQTDPSDRALRGGVIQSGRSLAESFNLSATRLSNLAESSFAEVTALTRQVNQQAEAIARLNSQIIALEANGSSANDLRDNRGQLLKEISGVVETRAIERESGSLDILVGGHLLVSGDRSSAMTAVRSESGRTELRSGRNDAPVTLTGGRIKALIDQEAGEVPGYLGRLDELAREMILGFNRIHSTGVPRAGAFRNLRSHYGAVDGDGDGTRGDEFLSQAGFPFEIERGELYVSISNDATGDLERHRIAIDPTTMSLIDVAAAIDGIEHVSASVDPTGRLRVTASNGYGFDFSSRIDPNPDTFGSLGGTNPTLGSGREGPFDLSGNTFPASLTVTTGTLAAPVTTTVTLDRSDFVNPAAATAAELAAAINSDLGSQGTAADVGGRLMIRSDIGGKDSQLSVADVAPGTLAADLGLPGITATGQASGVEITASGAYTGDENGRFTFVPSGDGTIGASPDLSLDVYDQNGILVSTLAVGAGYSPGEVLEVADGISISLGPGTISASAQQAFSLDTVADSDTSDFLVGIGLNSFFHGETAATISVNPELSANADLFAAGRSGAAGDAANLAQLIALRETQLDGLNSSSIETFYTDIVGDLGFDAAAADTTLRSQDALLRELETQREAISGVNLDEEMLDLTRYQQSYDAAARFISVVQEMTDTLISLAR